MIVFASILFEVLVMLQFLEQSTILGNTFLVHSLLTLEMTYSVLHLDRGDRITTYDKERKEDYHHGKIAVVKSEVGRGTTFRITLKRVEE